MPIIAVYDTAGIQDYIFSSNKLSENVGASRLVAEMLSKVLPDTIRFVCGKENCRIDWDAHTAEPLNPAFQAEIVYQGGGNACVVFRDERLFQSVSEKFLFAVMEKSRGLGIVHAAIETDLGGNYAEDYKKLNARLALAKGSLNRPAFMGNQPITKQSTRTGRPVTACTGDEYVDAAQKRKREKYASVKKEFPLEFPVESFEDLVKDTKDSFIGVIHADGNGMGLAIADNMAAFDRYETAVPKIRELSSKISLCYKSALARTCEAFKGVHVVKLIADGDDITVVMKGCRAIPFAAELLRQIEETPPEARPFPDVVPTACAGVALFHAHYPFSNAYALAEECCAAAKKRSRKQPGSYIDFHLHQGGNVADLETLRRRQYTVQKNTILFRPWRVEKRENKAWPSFGWLESNIAGGGAGRPFGWPRNKSKALRNAIGIGDQEAALVLDHAKSQGLELPDYPLAAAAAVSKFAPYFDILEIADLYEKREEEETQNNA